MPIERSEFESVNLPVDRFREKDPVWIEFASDAWPDERLQAMFFWNATTKRYSFKLHLVDYENGNEGKLLGWSPIQLNYPYFPTELSEWVRVIFHDPTSSASRVTAGNIGDPVEMTIWPGPASPAYEPFEIPEGEEDEFDVANPPEPWMPPLGIEETSVY